MKKIIIVILFLVLISAQKLYASTRLHEVISVGTSTPAVGTSTITGADYTSYKYFEALYVFQGTGTCFWRCDGGTVTTSNGHPLVNNGAFELDNTVDAGRVQFICKDYIGTITATYSTAKEPIQ